MADEKMMAAGDQKAFNDALAKLTLVNVGGFKNIVCGQLPASLCDVKKRLAENGGMSKISGRLNTMIAEWDPEKCDPISVIPDTETMSFIVTDGVVRTMAALVNGAKNIPVMAAGVTEEMIEAASMKAVKDESKASRRNSTPKTEEEAKVKEIFREYRIRSGIPHVTFGVFADQTAKDGGACLRWVLDVFTESKFATKQVLPQRADFDAAKRIYLNAPEESRDEVKVALTEYLKYHTSDSLTAEGKQMYPECDRRTVRFYIMADAVKTLTDIEILPKTCPKGPRVSGPGNTYKDVIERYFRENPEATIAMAANELGISELTIRTHAREHVLRQIKKSTIDRINQAYYSVTPRTYKGLAERAGVDESEIARWKDSRFDKFSKSEFDVEMKLIRERNGELTVDDMMNTLGCSPTRAKNILNQLGFKPDAEGKVFHNPEFGEPDFDKRMTVRKYLGCRRSAMGAINFKKFRFSTEIISTKTRVSLGFVDSYMPEIGFTRYGDGRWMANED